MITHKNAGAKCGRGIRYAERKGLVGTCMCEEWLARACVKTDWHVCWKSVWHVCV